MSVLKQFEHLRIPLEAIRSATNDFAKDHQIGRGGFGEVYKGELLLSQRRTTVALKRFVLEHGQGDREFWKEITTLSVYRHENIVSLLGFCDEKGERILVYEYASNSTLDLHLHRKDLTWDRRLSICIGAARGLAYLHDPAGTEERIIHRDVKSSNILLDENWNASIADLGLSTVANTENDFLIENAVGTPGYCDPYYIETGMLTKESDVYSFGVVLFEVLCGRLCLQRNHDWTAGSFTKMVQKHYKQNKLNEIILVGIKDQINQESLKAFATIAYQCLKRNHEKRPSMKDVVTNLENARTYQILTMPKQKAIRDPAWNHCTKADPTNPRRVQCNYCQKIMSGGIHRMKHHLAGTKKDSMPCSVVDEKIKDMFVKMLSASESKKEKAKDEECFEIMSDEENTNQDGSLTSFVKKQTQATMNQTLKKREPVVRALCRLLYGEALSFNLVKSPLWKEALTLVGEYGKGLKLPSYHEARVTYLKKEVECVETGLKKYKDEWKKTGCTIMSDGWTDGKQRSITNFLVNSPSGTVFVRSIDTSSFAKDAKDISWMDIHECFKEDEGTSSNKRKRGPRNLNKVRVANEKRKTTLVDSDTEDEFEGEEGDATRLHETTIVLDGDEDDEYDDFEA